MPVVKEASNGDLIIHASREFGTGRQWSIPWLRESEAHPSLSRKFNLTDGWVWESAQFTRCGRLASHWWWPWSLGTASGPETGKKREIKLLWGISSLLSFPMNIWWEFIKSWDDRSSNASIRHFPHLFLGVHHPDNVRGRKLGPRREWFRNRTNKNDHHWSKQYGTMAEMQHAYRLEKSVPD